MLKKRVFEHELYGKAIEFLKKRFALDARRIDEKRSINKRGLKGNKWLFPDLIAIENLSSNGIPEIKECAALHSGRKARLWSFEIKRFINGSNVREAYFQTISNSSWANIGYLVSADIIGDDAQDELIMLSALYGIGVILLNSESFIDSEILIPAKEKFYIDWLSFDRLAAASSDSKGIIKSLRSIYYDL